MLKLNRKVLLLMFIATAIISCKKDLQPEPTSGLPPDAQVLKNWFIAASTSSFSKRYLNNPDTIPLSGKPNWETIQKIENVSLIPVSLDIVSQNEEQDVKKYLAITTNTLGKPATGYYLYVINKAGASPVTMNELADYINGMPLKDFEGTLMKYSSTNKYIGSLNGNVKSEAQPKDNLLAKPGIERGPVPNYMPLPQGCNYVRIDWYFQHYENGLLIYEIYLYSTYEMNCGDNSGGGSTPDTIPVPHAYNPCLGADSLANNSQFKALFSTLKSKTADSSEYGYTYNQTNNSNTVNATALTGVSGYLDLPNSVPTSPIDGFIHSHFKIPGRSLSIFSDYDIQYLASLSKNNLIRDPSTFSAGVVTADGTQYLLRIEDPIKFQNFSTKVFNKIASFFIWDTYDKTILANNTTDANEKAFLNFLNKYDCGLKLFKGNNSFTSWQPLKVSNNVVTTTSCN